MGYLEDAFMTEKSDRYDVKGKNYIASLSKYYFQDLGLRNAILSFRQNEENHIMENIIYNELRYREANLYDSLLKWISLPIRGVSAIISNLHGGCRIQTKSSRKLVLCVRLEILSRRSLSRLITFALREMKVELQRSPSSSSSRI